MNPRTPTGQPPQDKNRAFPLKKSKIDWNLFKEWLFKEYMPVTAKDRLRYALKYHQFLLSGDLSRLMLMSESQRVHTMKALSCLSKFLGIHEDFKRMVKNHGLKWGSKRGDLLIIKRLTGVTDPNEIFEWIIQVKKAAPEYSCFMDFIAATGIRYNEAIGSYNLIVNLAAKGRLEEYYRNEVLEHFRFKEFFIRRSKKLFISFVPESVIRKILEKAELVDWSKIKKSVAWRVGRLRFADIREFWASYMTRRLSQPEIDFLQGRVSMSVFMKNYFNPVWIRDLKDRTLKAQSEILMKINV